MMSFESPKFSTIIDNQHVLLTVEAHKEQPAVLFEMLGATTLRAYNVQNPKEENMYLAPAIEADSRIVISELDTFETFSRMRNLVTEFGHVCEDLRDISENQLLALFDHAQDRLEQDL